MHDALDKIDEIFWNALEITSDDERREYLDRACGKDGTRRQRLEKMLKAQPKAEPFLEKPFVVPITTIDQSSAEQPGTMIGPYELLEEIGEGGMGVVFMAEQRDPIARKVALKVIKPGLATREVIGRFEVERQALALMDHLNIARVLDAGATESGRPYFVMELVDGIRLTEYCDQNHLDTRERLALFVCVCQAVQHAHQKGIIHRDLKPSNVLVTHRDGTPVPKIIDFGVAKAVDQRLGEKTTFTRFGQMIGTPLYMSPEQAEHNGLDIDTRSDIYSLGVLLYELLTGTTPFEKERFKTASYDEICSIIREEEPPRPSEKITTLGEAAETVSSHRNTDPGKLGHLLRGELDWIVMKSLEKDRTRRYETATAFAQDVQRYLDDETVEACPPSTAYRFRKFVRRNKTALATTVVVALALVLGLAGTTWQSIRVTRALHGETEAKNLARQRLGEVEQQRAMAENSFRLAEKNFALAFDAVDQMLTEVASENLADVPQADAVRRAVLEKALAFYEGFLEERVDDLQVLRETARAQFRLGEVQALLGEHKEAEEAYRQAISAFEKLLADDPKDGDNRHELAEGHLELGRVLGIIGQKTGKEKACRQALTLAESLVDEYPEEQKYVRLLALAFASVGDLFSRGDIDEAERLYQQAEELLEECQFDSDPESQGTAARVGQSTASLKTTLGQLKEAADAYRRCVTVWEDLSSREPENAEYQYRLAVASCSLAWALHSQGENQEAEELCRKAIDINRKLVADFPRVPRYCEGLAASLSYLSPILSDISGGGQNAIRERLEIQRQLLKEYPNVPNYSRSLAGALHNMGNVHNGRSEREHGETCFREALAINERLSKAWPNEPKHLGRIALNKLCIGLTLSDGGDSSRYNEGEVAYRDSIRIYRELADRFPRVVRHRAGVAYCMGFLGRLLHRMGRLEEAEETFRDSVTRYEKVVAEVPENAGYREWLANNKQSLAVVSGELFQGQIEETPEDADLWYRRSRQLADEKDFTGALLKIDEALRLEPENVTFQAERKRVSHEFDTFLIDLASCDQVTRQPLTMPEPPTGQLTFVNLDSVANLRLDEGLFKDNDLSELPQGRQAFAGVDFEIGDALIQLTSSHLWPTELKCARDILVGQEVATLYILHGVRGAAHSADDAEVGYYIVRYEDDTTLLLPVAIGRDVREWWDLDDSQPVSQAAVVWEGYNSLSRAANKKLRLYVGMWKNPHPQKPVAKIDYVLYSTNSHPFCIAMTIEGPSPQPGDD